MSAKILPGEWRFEAYHDGEWAITTELGFNRRVVASRSAIPHLSEESNASGRLMAAAPKLIDVVRRAYDYLDAELHGIRPPENVLNLTRDIRAAIAKAEDPS